ncbi:MAG: hypothetical protein VW907_08310, partial [Opitutae bacterium]
MSYILIKEGTYRNNPVQNTVFPVVKDFTEGAKGTYITVDASKVIAGRDTIRINVASKDDAVFV